MGIAIREIDSAGNRIAAINGDKKIRIWSADTCELLQTIDHEAKHVAFMHGQDRLLSVDYNEVATVWDLGTGKKTGKKRFTCKNSGIYFLFRDIAVSQNSGNVLLNTSAYIKIVNATLKTELLHYDVMVDNGDTLYHKESGLYVFVDNDDDNKSVIHIFDINRAEIIKSKTLDDGFSARFLFSQGGEELVFTASEKLYRTDENGQRVFAGVKPMLMKWNLEHDTTQKIAEFSLAKNEMITKMCWHEEGHAIAVLTNLQLFTLSGSCEEQKILFSLPEKASYYDMIYNDTGKQFILCYGLPCSDKTEFSYEDLYNPEMVRVPEDGSEAERVSYGGFPPVNGDCGGSVHYSEKNDRLIVHQKFSVEIWNTKTWELENRIFQHKAAKHIDMNTYFQETCQPFEFGNGIEDCKISPNGQMTGVVGDCPGLASAMLYDGDGQPLRVLQHVVNSRAERLAFSNNSEFVLVDYSENGLSLHGTKNGQQLHQFTDHNIQYSSHDSSQSHQTIRFSPDDAWVATGFDAGSIWIWNCKTGGLDHGLCAVELKDDDTIGWQTFETLPPKVKRSVRRDAEVYCLLWLPDGKSLLIGTDSGLYRWDLDQGEVCYLLDGEVHGLALWQNPDNRNDYRMAVYEDDEGLIKILDASFQEIGSTDSAGYYSETFLAFSEDGEWILEPDMRINWKTGQAIDSEASVRTSPGGLYWDGISDSAEAVGYSSSHENPFFKKWTLSYSG